MARRSFNVFNMSFLDCMSCGFGAVILMFMIINSQEQIAPVEPTELTGETDRLEQEILDGRKNLVRLRTKLEDTQQKAARSEEEIQRLDVMLDQLRIQLAEMQTDSLAREESVEDLEADIERLEEMKKQISDAQGNDTNEGGTRLRSYTGTGNRQYLTGLKMGGKRVVILVDSSTSMLGETFVNVLRYRNMSDDLKRRTPKWRQTVKTVDWITTQIEPGTQVQVLMFNETVESAMGVAASQWVTIDDGTELTAAVQKLKTIVPTGGTSLYRAFEALDRMEPRPDNVYLLTDGLPTQGKNPPAKPERVKPEQRIRFLEQAVQELPRGVPINIILYPMDGDPQAAGFLWELAGRSRGSFMAPSGDWP